MQSVQDKEQIRLSKRSDYDGDCIPDALSEKVSRLILAVSVALLAASCTKIDLSGANQSLNKKRPEASVMLEEVNDAPLPVPKYLELKDRFTPKELVLIFVLES